jgi:hypothetical protein
MPYGCEPFRLRVVKSVPVSTKARPKRGVPAAVTVGTMRPISTVGHPFVIQCLTYPLHMADAKHPKRRLQAPPPPASSGSGKGVASHADEVINMNMVILSQFCPTSKCIPVSAPCCIRTPNSG